MFIHNLNLEQQVALVKTVEILINSDGFASDEEVSILNAIKEQCDDRLEIPEDFKMDYLATLFETEREKVSFLLELIAVAYIDGIYHTHEESLILEVANTIGLSSKKLGALENWVSVQVGLNQLAVKFME